MAAVIRKALAKDPAQRYSSIQEMIEDVFGSEQVLTSSANGAEEVVVGDLDRDGDILSENGRIVRRNLSLVAACDPLEDCANFGLDSLDFQAAFLQPREIEEIEMELELENAGE